MLRNRRSAAMVGSKRHAIVFFTTYIVGAVILTFEKTIFYSFFDPASSLLKAVIILTALILMGGYVILVTLVPATKLRNDVAADNVYYLGFLYTLTSLAIALSVDSPDAILANFGVAIVSTLIGIAARVGLNQLRIDPNDIEEASRLELAEATRRVKSEMTETVTQLSDFRQLSLQVLAEGYADIQANVDLISQKVLKSVEDLAEKSAKPLLEMAEKTKAAHIDAARSIESVTESTVELTSTNKRAIEKIDAVSNALVTLTEHYADTGMIDDKIISALRDQLVSIQAKLAEGHATEISELTTALRQFNEKTLADKGHEIQAGTAKELDRLDQSANSVVETVSTETVGRDAAGREPAASKRSYVQNYEHRGTTILYRGQRQGYFVFDRQYMTLEEAKAAVDRRLNLTANRW